MFYILRLSIFLLDLQEAVNGTKKISLCAVRSIRDYANSNMKASAMTFHLNVKCARVQSFYQEWDSMSLITINNPFESKKESFKTIVPTINTGCFVGIDASQRKPHSEPFHAFSAAVVRLLTPVQSSNPQTRPSSLGLVLDMFAHSPHLVAIFIKDKRHRRHDSSDDGHDCQRPVRAYVLVHLDRGWGQRAGYYVA